MNIANSCHKQQIADTYIGAEEISHSEVGALPTGTLKSPAASESDSWFGDTVVLGLAITKGCQEVPNCSEQRVQNDAFVLGDERKVVCKLMSRVWSQVQNG